MADLIIRKSFKYRIYPTAKQVEVLNLTLSEACRLYNAALQERAEAWQRERKNISLYEQMAQLTEIRHAGHLEIANAQASRDPLRRVDKAFKAFYRRCKSGEAPGYPRFKSWKSYNSITFENGVKLSERLHLHGIGRLRIKLHREIEGLIKTTTIKREGNKWFATFSCEVECSEPLSPTNESIGLDVGIESFVTLSDGTQIDNWKYYESEQKRLRVAQRRVARRKKGSNRRRKAVSMLRAIHQKIANRRNDFQHKLSTDLVRQYDLIAVEDLSIKGLAQGILAKQVNDVSWGSFFDKLAYKAVWAGRKVIKVNPNYTSQDCSGCGHREKKALSERQHNCDQCGLSLHRDHNAALNILRAGLALQTPTYGVTQSVV